MENYEIQTDTRLISILTSGKHFLASIDPEGLIPETQPQRLILDFEQKTWIFTLQTEGGTTFNIHGKINGNVLTLSYLTEGKAYNNKYQLKTAKETLYLSLGQVSSAPAFLKQAMKRGNVPSIEKTKEQDALPFFKNIFDAIFFQVDDIQDKSKKKAFKYWSVKYNYSDKGNVSLCNLRAIQRYLNGNISVFCDVDIYGLGNKKVILNKRLGKGHHASIDCQKEQNGTMIPTLKLAMDLEKVIPVLYGTEKREKRSMGKPKAK